MKSRIDRVAAAVRRLLSPLPSSSSAPDHVRTSDERRAHLGELLFKMRNGRLPTLAEAKGFDLLAMSPDAGFVGRRVEEAEQAGDQVRAERWRGIGVGLDRLRASRSRVESATASTGAAGTTTGDRP